MGGEEAPGGWREVLTRARAAMERRRRGRGRGGQRHHEGLGRVVVRMERKQEHGRGDEVTRWRVGEVSCLDLIAPGASVRPGCISCTKCTHVHNIYINSF
jgi:hypothetical protein